MGDSRVGRERDFHNTRFNEDFRLPVEKYYRTISLARNRFENKVFRAAQGKEVLEIGCATGARTCALAPHVDRICAIDISDVAIDKAIAYSKDIRQPNVEFLVQNAEDMVDLSSGEFDLVFGTGILHHLNLDNAYREICRVLKVGGEAVFFEPLGHNPFINIFRKFTPSMRSEDEHPFLMRDIRAAERHFSYVGHWEFGLFTIATFPFVRLKQFDVIKRPFEWLDLAVLSLPYFNRFGWIVVLTLKK